MMPPQVKEHRFDWKEQAPQLQVRKASRIEKVSAVSFLHQEVRWQNRNSLRLEWPDAQEGRWVSVFAPTGSDMRQGHAWNLNDLRRLLERDELGGPFSGNRFSMAGLRFAIAGEGRERLELLDPRRPGHNVWAMSLDGLQFHWKSDGLHFFGATDLNEGVVYFINPRSFRSVDKWTWDKSTYLADVILCPGRKQIVIENLPEQGISRFVGFYETQPQWYTVFDFSGGKKESFVSQVLTRNCVEFWVTTPEGMHRLSY